MTTQVLVIDDQGNWDEVLGGDNPHLDVTHVTDLEKARYFLFRFQWDGVWLDHDLGPGGEVKDLIKELEETDQYDLPKVGKFFVHTMNPVEAPKMVAALKRLGYKVERVHLPVGLDRSHDPDCMDCMEVNTRG